MTRAFGDAQLHDLWFELGAEVGGMPQPAFTSFVRTEVQKWGKVVRETNVVIE